MPTVRPAETHDMPQIMAFDSLPGDRIVEIIERHMLVGEIDGVVKGYVSWKTGGCIGKDYINKLVINADSRRRGMARLLLARLSSTLSGRVFISAPVGNRAALKLLERTGWMKAGEIIGASPTDEAIVFFYRDMAAGSQTVSDPIARLAS